MGKPIDETNFYLREWCAALRALRIPLRPFYNTHHTYISTLLAAGAKPLFICRQTGTSLEMIEKHYGNARVDAAQLNDMICRAEWGTVTRGNKVLAAQQIGISRQMLAPRITDTGDATSSSMMRGS